MNKPMNLHPVLGLPYAFWTPIARQEIMGALWKPLYDPMSMDLMESLAVQNLAWIFQKRIGSDRKAADHSAFHRMIWLRDPQVLNRR